MKAKNIKKLTIINLPSVDWNISLKLASGKEQLAKYLHRKMLHGLLKEKKLINLAFNSKSLLDLKEYIHKLHGGCCYTGFIKLKHIAKQLEIELSINQLNNKFHYNYNVIKQYIHLINQEISFLVSNF